MASGHDAGDRRVRRERGSEGDEESVGEEGAETHPQPELRWVRLREPRHAIEMGPNGRILDHRYHEGYDAWEVLLETYEGELG
ncbi:hypothetical protein [Halorussus salinisoli]|uniref:hypothetical protein n=1 Tax=Halorussus salinisoli TaxID=2558242 RepID=UPI0010C17099|nr:hypothetical protein [Halorussus salinisoli]